MTEVINLRTARKRANRRKEEERAAANRLTHGRSKATRELERARKKKTDDEFEGHRLDTSEGQ